MRLSLDADLDVHDVNADQRDSGRVHGQWATLAGQGMVLRLTGRGRILTVSLPPYCPESLLIVLN